MKLSRRVILIIIIFFNFIFSFSEDKIEVYPPYLELEDGMKIPQLPTDDLTEVDLQGNIIGKRELEKNTTVYLESRVNVFVPLEIISDIDIEAIILDNQKLEIPFEVEFNKVPEKKDYYKLCYSETEIDIDQDGKTDTFIYSSPFINTWTASPCRASTPISPTPSGRKRRRGSSLSSSATWWIRLRGRATRPASPTAATRRRFSAGRTCTWAASASARRGWAA